MMAPLHYAAKVGSLSAIEALIDNGADVGITDMVSIIY